MVHYKNPSNSSSKGISSFGPEAKQNVEKYRYTHIDTHATFKKELKQRAQLELAGKKTFKP